MTKFIGKMESSSPKEESESPREESRIEAIRLGLQQLKLESSDIRPGSRSHGGRSENWGPSRYLIGNDDGYQTSSENYSLLNYTDGDDDTPTFIKCQLCTFDFKVPEFRHHLEVANALHPKNVICPLCVEILGEEAIRDILYSIPRKPTRKSDKYGSSSGYLAKLEKKHPAFVKRNESMSDPRLSDVQSDEDSMSIGSDISIAKSSGTDAADSGDEQDCQEKSLKASFVQELVTSAVFSE